MNKVIKKFKIKVYEFKLKEDIILSAKNKESKLDSARYWYRETSYLSLISNNYVSRKDTSIFPVLYIPGNDYKNCIKLYNYVSQIKHHSFKVHKLTDSKRKMFMNYMDRSVAKMNKALNNYYHYHTDNFKGNHEVMDLGHQGKENDEDSVYNFLIDMGFNTGLNGVRRTFDYYVKHYVKEYVFNQAKYAKHTPEVLDFIVRGHAPSKTDLFGNRKLLLFNRSYNKKYGCLKDISNNDRLVDFVKGVDIKHLPQGDINYIDALTRSTNNEIIEKCVKKFFKDSNKFNKPSRKDYDAILKSNDESRKVFSNHLNMF